MRHKVNIRKIILSVSAIGMLGLTLTTSTYAWFKLNSRATVENFNINVIGGKGFMVSVDGGTYTNNLTTEQIQKAIAVAYGNGTYEIGYETNGDGDIIASDVLYHISKDSNNEIRRQKVENVDEVLENAMKNIELLPTTSMNGRNFYDQYNGATSLASGRYVQFGVYFKATSTQESDKLKYDIYMDGYEGKDENDNDVLPTSITSAITNVNLVTKMDTIEYVDGVKQKKTYDSGTIKVYSSNAMRISTTSSNKRKVSAYYKLTENLRFVDNKKYYTTNDLGVTYQEAEVTVGEEVPALTYYEYVDESYTYDVDTDSSLIYELNDTESKNTDLGSYATKCTESTAANMDDYYLYSSECNAMFTYYNRLKSNAKLTALDYGSQPKTIKSLPTLRSDDKNFSHYDTITTVESGGDEKLVTFRFWLEGWDADCFDGLANSIDVRLSFGSKRVN